MATMKQAQRDTTLVVEQTTASRLPGLDGLRAIAISTVLLFHLAPGILPGGYLGVDIFFVISGFIITTLLLREKATTGAIALSAFWRRRARRLLPALALVVLCSCTTALLVGGDVLVGIGRQVLGAATFSYNWLEIAGESSYFDSTTPELFRNLWSLAVEEQFYLLWPFVVLALLLWVRRVWMPLPVALLAVASGTGMVLAALAGSDSTRLYYGTDTHAFGLAIGAVLALLARDWSPRPLEWPRAVRRGLPVAGTAAVLALLALSWLLAEQSSLVFLGGLQFVALLSAIAIAGAIVPGSFLGKALDIPPLRWLGERSYGIYLWHWPLLVLTTQALPDADPWLRAGSALLVTVAAASLSYRFVELPLRRGGFRAMLAGWRAAFRSRPLTAIRAATASLAIAALVACSGAAVVTAPAAGVAQERIEAGQQAIEREPRLPSAAATAEPAVIPGGDQIYAIGDSVMLAAADELLAAFPGVAIDAAVSRRMSDAPAMVQLLKDSGSLRPILLIGLGTNGPVDEASLDQVKNIVGSQTEIVLINAQAPRGWIPEVNALLARYAQAYRNVELANWHDAIQPRLDVLARDKIHAGGAIGGQIYAAAVRDAIQRLAELPPLLNSNDYGLSPRPA